MIGPSQAATEIIVSLAKAMSKRPRQRNIALLISSTLLIIAVTAAIIISNPNSVVFVISIIISLSSGIVSIPALLSFAYKDVKTTSEKLMEIGIERERLVQKTEVNGNILDVIRLNLNQLDEYYTINKAQAKKSYSFSVITIIFGFLAIIFSIIYFIHINKFSEIVLITSLGGLIMEFIGATSLTLYKVSTKNINEFYNKLSYLQHIMLAVELSNKLNGDNKDKEISSIIGSLIHRQ